MAAKAGEKVVVGLRPESWHLVDAGADNGVDLKVELVEALGSESFIYGVPVGAEQEDGVASQRVTVHSDKRVRPEVGEVVHVVPEPQRGPRLRRVVRRADRGVSGHVTPRPGPWASGRFDVEGHRGAKGLVVENTLASFAAAYEAGVTGVELDVRLSADGERRRLARRRADAAQVPTRHGRASSAPGLPT